MEPEGGEVPCQALGRAVFTPEVFCCGVDIVGPSNLITWMNTIPPYWKPLEPLLWDRVGHPVKDAEFLRSRSPLLMVDRITKPLLIAQGKNDPRVPVAESIQIGAALKKAGKTVFLTSLINHLLEGNEDTFQAFNDEAVTFSA